MRASDGTLSADTTVTIDVTDVDEAEDDPSSDAEPEEAALQTVSEPAGEDLPADTSTSGRGGGG